MKKLSRGDKDTELKELLQEIYNEHHGNYDYHRITLELRNRGFIINHKKVQCLMKELGLTGRIRVKRRHSSYKSKIGKKADSLMQRHFEASKPYEECFIDITKFVLPEGKLYSLQFLTVIIASHSPDLKQVKRMLKKTFLVK
ncbi:transposase [Streptococcus porcinus]|uniref:Transposase n=1 Tax=Streptococcus porcinus TaxID=1340 RepID=A0A7V9WSX0_STRPO|nr:transposase [Streptococcus porcinus]